MSWRDKVQAMREGANSEIVPTPVPPKLPKPGFVGSVSTLPLQISEKGSGERFTTLAGRTPGA